MHFKRPDDDIVDFARVEIDFNIRVKKYISRKYKVFSAFCNQIESFRFVLRYSFNQKSMDVNEIAEKS